MATNVKLDLTKFRSSGVYTLEYDQTESLIVSPQTIKLVVGFSKTGPYNSPVYLTDIKTAKQVFGEIDDQLERKGCFFHRTIYKCLETGPVFALNLMKLYNEPTEITDVSKAVPVKYTVEPDMLEYNSMSLNPSEDNGVLTNKLVSSFYNKEKFWYLDTEYFLSSVKFNNNTNEIFDESIISDGTKFINFTNVGSKALTVLVRKAIDIKNFDTTARDFYGDGNIPSFIRRPYDLMKDYFIEVIAIYGNYGPDLDGTYGRLSGDPYFSKYFNINGLIKEQMESFIQDPAVTFAGRFVGTFIPDVIDETGVSYYIERMINNSTVYTGLFCSVNKKALDDYESNPSKIDLVGHNLYDILNSSKPQVNFLSYKTNLSESYDITRKVSDQTYFDLTEMPLIVNDFVSSENDVLNVFDINIVESNTKINGVDSLTDVVIRYSSEITDVTHPLYNTNLYDSIVTNKTTLIGKRYMPVLLNDDFYFFKVRSKSIITDSNNVRTVKLTITAKYSDVITEDINTHEVVDGIYFICNNKISSGLHFIQDLDNTYDLNDVADILYTYKDSKLYSLINSNIITSNDTVQIYKDGVLNNYRVEIVKYNEAIGNVYDNIKNIYGALTFDYYTVKFILSDTDPIEYLNSGDLFFNDTTKSKQSSPEGLLPNVHYEVNPNVIYIITDKGSLTVSYPVVRPDASIKNIVNVVDESYVQYIRSNKIAIKPGDLLLGDEVAVGDESSFLTRVLSVKLLQRNNYNDGKEFIQITTSEAVKVSNGYISIYQPIDKWVSQYTLTCLKGFNLKAHHMPNGTNKRMEELFALISPNTNLFKTLIEQDFIQFRYIVDCYNHGIGIAPENEQSNSAKRQLATLAKSRKKCLAILNAPSVQEFIDSKEPLFTDRPTSSNPKPTLKAEYIAEGGNLDLYPSFTFRLPIEDEGAKYCGFFTPNLLYRERGVVKSIPPAMYVANLFIQKNINGRPFAIIAGSQNGVIRDPNLIGLEYLYTTEDRDFIEPFGLNPIINKRNVGIEIYANQTSFQSINSALNNLHVRDTLITIEERIEDVLERYLFQFNDASIRTQIETSVNLIMSEIKSAGGVYDYKVVMNDINNPPEVIDQNFGILDVGVEMARGMHKFINRITILKTRTIASGGFTVA